MINEKYQFHLLLSYSTIVHGISSKASGSIKKDKTHIDREKLMEFAQDIGITGDIVCMRQIHSGTVRVVADASDLRIPETDAMITNKKHLPLGVLTADCLPLLFYDPVKEVIGVAHAGYKGLLNHIIENTIQRFVATFKCDPKHIMVGIGPSIERDCYEVDEERINEFTKAFPQFRDIYVERDGKFYLDLRSVARQCLLKEGILEEHREIMDICTKCNRDFYSYRRGDEYERFMSVISLV